MRLADAEGDEHDSDIDPEILESAGAVRLHIIAHYRFAVNAECKKDRCRNDTRAVLALRAMPEHRTVVLIDEGAHQLAECLERGLGGDHRAVGLGKVGASTALDLHDLLEDRRTRVSGHRGVLLIGQRRDMEIIDALGNHVLLVRKLCGRAEVDDGAQALLIAQSFGYLGLDLSEMTAAVKHTVTDGLAVSRGNAAKVAEIADLLCHIYLPKQNRTLLFYHKIERLSTPFVM